MNKKQQITIVKCTKHMNKQTSKQHKWNKTNKNTQRKSVTFKKYMKNNNCKEQLIQQAKAHIENKSTEDK